MTQHIEKDNNFENLIGGFKPSSFTSVLPIHLCYLPHEVFQISLVTSKAVGGVNVPVNAMICTVGHSRDWTF